MKLGRLFGILAILGGGYVTYMGYEMMQTTGSVFKFVIAAPVFVLIGIAMLFFPVGTLQQPKAGIRLKIQKHG
jgi:uncharacterized membrane protein